MLSHCKAALNSATTLERMAREGLALPLRAAINQEAHGVEGDPGLGEFLGAVGGDLAEVAAGPCGGGSPFAHGEKHEVIEGGGAEVAGAAGALAGVIHRDENRPPHVAEDALGVHFGIEEVELDAAAVEKSVGLPHRKYAAAP